MGNGHGGNRRNGKFKPTKFTVELGIQVLERLRDGDSITSICNSSMEMPTVATFWHWTNGDLGAPEGFKKEYEAARRAQASTMAAQTLDIAESLDENARRNAELEAEAVVSSGGDERDIRRAMFRSKKRSVEAAKEQIKARRWMAGRMHPQRWGDRMQVDHATPDGAVKIDLTKLSDDQLEKIAALEAEVSSGD